MNARAAFVSFVALLTVTSVAAVPAGSLAPTGVGVLPSHVTPAGQTYDASDEVNIWERGIFTLRAGSTSDSVSFTNAFWTAQLPNTGQKTLVKDTVRIYRTGTSIPFTFDDARAGGHSLANENVQLVAARLDGNQSKALSSFSTLSQLQSILSKSNADSNATFYGPQSATLDGSGEHTFNFNPTDPGQYIVFVASTDHGSLSVTNGDIFISQNNVTIVGVDQVTVMDAQSSVSPGKSQYSAGDDVTFSVDATSGLSAGENASHAILLYDQDTYESGTFNLVSDDNLNDQWSVKDNVTLEHDIASVNGVHKSSGNPEFYGTTAEDGTADGSPSVASILDFMVQNTTLSDSLRPANSPQSPNTELDASITVLNGSRSTSITVGTRGDWRAACYRWVHVATNQSGIEHAADTGEVGIGTSCPTDGGGDDDDDDGGGGGDGGVVSTPGTYVTTSGQVNVKVVDDDLTTRITVQGTTPGTTLSIHRSSQQITDQLAAQRVSLDDIDVGFAQSTAFSISLQTGTTNPDPSIPDPPDDARAIGFIQVDHDAPPGAISEARFTFRVRPSLLNDRGIDPSEVVLYRFDGSEWVALETHQLESTRGGTLRFLATSPDGLSVFAIGARQAATPTPTPTPTTEPPATEPPTPTPSGTVVTPTTTETPGGLPGFTAGLALVALALVSLLARRRRR